MFLAQLSLFLFLSSTSTHCSHVLPMDYCTPFHCSPPQTDSHSCCTRYTRDGCAWGIPSILDPHCEEHICGSRKEHCFDSWQEGWLTGQGRDREELASVTLHQHKYPTLTRRPHLPDRALPNPVLFTECVFTHITNGEILSSGNACYQDYE